MKYENMGLCLWISKWKTINMIIVYQGLDPFFNFLVHQNKHHLSVWQTAIPLKCVLAKILHFVDTSKAQYCLKWRPVSLLRLAGFWFLIAIHYEEKEQCFSPFLAKATTLILHRALKQSDIRLKCDTKNQPSVLYFHY